MDLDCLASSTTSSVIGIPDTKIISSKSNNTSSTNSFLLLDLFDKNKHDESTGLHCVQDKEGQGVTMGILETVRYRDLVKRGKIGHSKENHI